MFSDVRFLPDQTIERLHPSLPSIPLRRWDRHAQVPAIERKEKKDNIESHSKLLFQSISFTVVKRVSPPPAPPNSPFNSILTSPLFHPNQSIFQAPSKVPKAPPETPFTASSATPQPPLRQTPISSPNSSKLPPITAPSS